LLLGAVTAPAQYFGRNKVQWEDFDFQVMKTEHFDIYYYQAESPEVEAVARMAERWYVRLSEAFGHQLSERKPIVLYANHADFQQTTVSGGLIGEGVGGFTESFLHRLVMPLTGSMSGTDHVLGHEMVHVFQFDIIEALRKKRSRSRGESRSLQPLPLWMIEGLAEYLSTGPLDNHTGLWLRDALRSDKLPDLKTLSRDPRYFPYRWGQAFWAYVGGRWGEDKVVELFRKALEVNLKTALKEVLETDAETFADDWQEAIRTAMQPVLDRVAEGKTGERRLGSGEQGQPLNLAPVLSPDGRRLAFLSSRELFDIDLYLADAATGRVEKRLAGARSDPHFDSLRFLDSAGAWSPDGDRFAFVVVARGDNLITIVDTASNDVVQRLTVPDVPAILNIAWSPDGSRLALAGASQGVSDLYLFDLASGDVERLTDDFYADLQPAWSPDGGTLAFVSDRGSGSSIEDLSFGPLHISLLDLDSRSIRNLQIFPHHKHISPQYSADGSSLFFISDPNGVSNVYRWDFEHEQVFQVTDVATGVTGITAEAPALSVARSSGELAFTVFENTEYSVFTLAPAQAQGWPVEEAMQPRQPLPPVAERKDDTLVGSLEDSEEGLPPVTEHESEVYSPKLKLALAGTAGVGAVVDEYGYGIAGGVSLYYTDILGDHQVGASFLGATYQQEQFNFGAQATYLNRTSRLTWGAFASHIPYRRAGAIIYPALVEIEGQQLVADVVEQIRETVTVDQTGVLGFYPFSMTRRFEASASYNHFGFDATLEQLVLVDGYIVDRSLEDLATRPGYGYSNVSAAYVVDTSYFGFTSPLRGTRMRLEAGTVFGDFEFQTLLADYRRYFFAKPWSLAVRGLYFGRHGGGSEDPQLAPLNVGQEVLVRGYSVGSFSFNECSAPPPGQIGGCPEYERLEGSRMGVVNLELRLQALGTQQLGLAEARFAPTELVAFVDIGAAWTADESLDFRFEQDTTDRVPVVSAGIAARVLLGGVLPIQFYAAHPFQRPKKDWVYGFLIAPGW